MLGLLGFAQPAPDGVILPRTPGQTVSLATGTPRSYLETASSETGIFKEVNGDATTPVRILDADAITSLVDQFDSTLRDNLYSEFKNGEADFRSIVAHISGQSMLPEQVRTSLQPFITNLEDPGRASLALSRISDISLIASSSGILINLDTNNYFYNVAYQTPIVQSGRSYGVSGGRNLLDQSDAGYLGELDAYLKTASADEASKFYRAVFQILVQSSGGGLSSLIPSGQIAATDFMTVYTAELIRHNMVNLDPVTDPWEIDIGEVTLATNYGATSGQVMVNGKLTPGTADAYGKKAIGDTRKDFMKLDQQISAFETAQHPALVKAVLQLTNITDESILSAVGTDIFRRVFVFLNRPEFQSDIDAHSDAFVTAIAALLAQVRTDSGQITAYVKSH